jgi:hypothetical protein
MNDVEKLLGSIYEAFNRRDIDTGVPRRDEVRSYWTRQWAVLDPTVVPVAFEQRSHGSTSVLVHQTVRDLSGTLLNDGEVVHVYTFEDGLIKAMDIELAPNPKIDRGR